jgi:hypothetical protein
MTIGSDNLSNGSATAQDRFSGGVSAYRADPPRSGAGRPRRRRELIGRRDSWPLPTRSPGMSGSMSQALRADQRTGSAAARLPSLDLHGLTEPVFPSTGWTDSGSPSPSMADHPLLRGLLLELPPRGTMPASGLAGPVVRGRSVHPRTALMSRKPERTVGVSPLS